MIANYFLYFIVYSFIGWLWEVLVSLAMRHKLINRGFLIGPYCPIYGVGALIFILINPYVENPVLMFLAGGLIACAIEYLTSLAMEKAFGARWWDYSEKPLNLNGRICLYGFIAFGIGAVIIKYSHPTIANWIDSLPARNIIAIVTAFVFVLDIAATSHSLAKFSKIVREYQKQLAKGPVVKFIEKRGQKLIAIASKHPIPIFTYQQKRIMKAFPYLKTGYGKAFAELQKIYNKTKFKPEQSPNARKKP